MDIEKEINENINKMYFNTFSIFNNKRSTLLNMLNCAKKYLFIIDDILELIDKESEIKLDCSEGCRFCCYIKVEAKAHEILLIADYIENNLDEKIKEQIIVKANNNKNFTMGYSFEEHLTKNIECPLLFENKCITYSVRPAICRIYHSMNLTKCMYSFKNPTDLTAQKPEHPFRMASGMKIRNSFENALHKTNYDLSCYDLSSGLFEALTKKSLIKKWQKKKQVFPDSAKSKRPITIES